MMVILVREWCGCEGEEEREFIEEKGHALPQTGECIRTVEPESNIPNTGKKSTKIQTDETVNNKMGNKQGLEKQSSPEETGTENQPKKKRKAKKKKQKVEGMTQSSSKNSNRQSRTEVNSGLPDCLSNTSQKTDLPDLEFDQTADQQRVPAKNKTFINRASASPIQTTTNNSNSAQRTRSLHEHKLDPNNKHPRNNIGNIYIYNAHVYIYILSRIIYIYLYTHKI